MPGGIKRNQGAWLALDKDGSLPIHVLTNARFGIDTAFQTLELGGSR